MVKDVITGFLVIYISIMPSTDVEQPLIGFAFKVKNTEPLTLSKGPGR